MSLTLRPTFSMELACPSQVVLARLYARLSQGPQNLRRSRVPGGGDDKIPEKDTFVITVPPTEQRLWSPWLTVEVTARGEGAHLFGRFGPHPAVWTGFAFFYLVLGVLFLFSLVFAGALIMTRGQPWSLWVAAATLVLMGLMLALSKVGQHWARPQMEVLRAELWAAPEACALAPPAHDA